MRHNARGFTIVELLIVIVVIGILAAITIVAYNGMQERARAVARQHAASQTERQIMTHALQANGESVSLGGSLVGYQEGVGETALLRPLTGMTGITMYAVYDVTSTTENYGTLAMLTPSGAGQHFRLQTAASGSSTMSFRFDTSAQANVTGSIPGIRTIGNTLIGWMQVGDNATTRAAGYNQAAAHVEGALSPSAGWNFTSLDARGTASGTTQAALVFDTAHDQTTRAQVIDWLAEKYGVNL